ncbi:MAG TPA: hypothetical protein PK024_12070 [Methanospirillum sp.]|nr:hypothetical protein [Methanospirillum sp.]HOJ97559.1 hypothetical protein [Methanospirillum sp.]HOL41955.1 hypothetical protein [Methanospirillum sp.]HPP78103.1 hypothetical protein [Methanospirillum sp.]
MTGDIPASSFFRALQEFLIPSENESGIDSIGRKKREVCRTIEEMLSDYANMFCGEITPEMDFQMPISHTIRMAEQIEMYARYLDLLDEHLEKIEF